MHYVAIFLDEENLVFDDHYVQLFYKTNDGQNYKYIINIMYAYPSSSSM